MQRLYKVEIFDNEFNLVGHSAITQPDISIDYLSLNSSTITCLQNIGGLKQYQLVHITNNVGNVIFQGILYGFLQEKNSLLQITVKPLLSLIDRTFTTQGYITEYDTIEGWIKYFLATSYQGDANIPPSYSGIDIKVTSETPIGETRDPEMSQTMGMYDYAISAMQSNGIIVSCEFDPQAKTFSFVIGKNNKEEKTIETDLPNIISKTFNLDGDGEQYNVVKLFFKDENEDIVTRWYALNEDGSIAETTPPNYNLSNVKPPLMMTYNDIGTGYNTTDKYPSDSVWIEKAKEVLKPDSDSQEISISVSDDDNLVKIGITDIGGYVQILHDGKTYKSMLTSVSIVNDVKTLTFGYARTDLTSILQFQRRGKTW